MERPDMEASGSRQQSDNSQQSSDSACPCGSGQCYRQCCGPWHEGAAAPTPEALMRSRYCAFVLRRADYLLASWHPETRPASLSLHDTPQWTALHILQTDTEGDRGAVHYRALYRADGGWGFLQEQADFVNEQGRWYYVAGNITEGRMQPGRNEPCPCGSGKKYKACCR